ncbi:DCL family protein [Stigmatella sp. ncwal1]|uniref:DCL family protein n=1 Tax=Stigmatella ashevillensis TaxID=2995309 RepID=A0ABT5DCX0_9BACT|nr:DCL family protein [Stigmatella ashevillena]MDC0711476.1 DCL family protein [Stigmatella ashevillena]
MAIPFIVPSMSFKSRKAAKDYIRDNILHAYPLRERIDQKKHHQLLSEVLELHSHADEKIGPGIDHFYVEETWRLDGKEMVGRDKRAIMVVRKDQTNRDWSYTHVIDNPTPMANVKSALASALEPERVRRRDEDFASGAPIFCAVSSKLIPTKQQADTRHLDPTWHVLTERFVKQHGGWEAIETHSGKDKIYVGRDVEDTALRDEWLRYYAKEARPVYVKND